MVPNSTAGRIVLIFYGMELEQVWYGDCIPDTILGLVSAALLAGFVVFGSILRPWYHGQHDLAICISCRVAYGTHQICSRFNCSGMELHSEPV
jgi:hypothetical protein